MINLIFVINCAFNLLIKIIIYIVDILFGRKLSRNIYFVICKVYYNILFYLYVIWFIEKCQLNMNNIVFCFY